MLYLRQSTASQEVLLGPFVDDTDGKTAETALTIANTDIKLWLAGATTLANKNSGGATHISNGNYYAVLDATDTATIGSGEIVVQVSGALPVRRPFTILHANVYDTLFGSTALSTYAGGAVASVTGAVGSVTGNVGGNVVGSVASVTAGVTVTTNNDKTGYSLTTAPLDAAGVRAAVGLASANLDTQLSTIDDFLDTEIAAIKAKTDNLPSDPADASDIAASFTSIASTLTTIADYIDTEVAAIKAKTDNLPASFPANFASLVISAGGIVDANVASFDGNDAGLFVTDTLDDMLNAGVALKADVKAWASREDAINTVSVSERTIGGSSSSVLAPKVGANVTRFDGYLASTLIHVNTSIPAIEVHSHVHSFATDAKAEINAEVVDVLTTDNQSEPTSVPAANASIASKIGWIFMLGRNRRTQTATTETVYADDGSTSRATSSKSDDGTTMTRGEYS